MNILDMFNDDAFSAVELTAAINNMDTVPGDAGRLAFESGAVGEGIPTTEVAIEIQNEAVQIVPEKPRGAPATKETRDPRSMIKLSIPHFPLEDTIQADEVQDVREFGTNEPLSPMRLVESQFRKMNARHDLTLEHLRVGAIKGQIKGAEGAILVDLFEEFGITNSDGLHAPEKFDFDLDNYASDAEAIRTKCHAVQRYVRRNARMFLPTGTQIIAFAGDNFFDKLVENPSVKKAYAGSRSAEERLGGNYAGSAFEFGGIVFINYVGTDDNATVALETDECRMFLSGVPGLFAEYYAPANFMETTNTPGLPRYAKISPDKRFNQAIEVHTQQNPLPICLRPKTLVRGIASAESE